MAGCCGGKNAGKPISRARYALGLAFFTGYHGAVHAALSGAALLSPRMAPVRAFHTNYFGHLLREAVGREGIVVGESAESDESCRV